MRLLHILKNNMKKCKIYILFSFLIIAFSSCREPIKKCENPKKGKAILVAYRVAKHTHLWFQNIETKYVYDVGGVGGRREPNISLGDTINIQYCGNSIIFNKYDYVKIPINRDTRFRYLKGFKYLY